MNSRTRILKKLNGTAHRPSITEVPDTFPLYDSKASSLLNQFRHTAQSNGIDIEIVENLTKIPPLIKAHNRSQSVGEKICIAPALNHLAWDFCGNPHFGSNDGSYVIGINCAQAAVAQTGALVFINHPENPASISFLSREHFIILNETDIQASMSEIWECGLKHSNAIHLIAGLSSTADIGGKLLVGVHGPEKLTCIIVSNY